ncbi:MAG: hypothetical protein GC134_04300 [Proteobacteria bacterium]|nr:hypothetical protein [Pseudomonadota bacterium]
MRFYSSWLGFLILLLAVATPSARADDTVGIPVLFKLSNGLRVVVAPDHRAPVVVQMVWYKAGSIDDTPGKTGIAHMLEHMMFRGTKDVPAGQFADRVAAMGGRLNANTNQSGTDYYEEVAKQYLPDVMKLEADRMAGLDLSDALFKPERDVVMEERNLRYDSIPQKLFYEQFYRRFYSVSPQGNPTIGWPQDIRNFTAQDARDWYANFYTPNNAVLLLAGDVTPEEGKKLAEKYYGQIAPRAVLRKPAPLEPVRYEARRVTVHNPDAPTQILARAYRGPGWFEGIAGAAAPVNDIPVLVILARILGYSQTGLLHQELVVNRGLADSVAVYYDPAVRGEVPLSIEVLPKAGVDMAKVEKALDEVLASLLTSGVDEATVTRLVTATKFDQVYVRDDPYLYAYNLGRWLISGGTLDAYINWPDKLPAITPADVLRVARTYLRLEQSATGYLMTTPAPDQTTQPDKGTNQPKEGGL